MKSQQARLRKACDKAGCCPLTAKCVCAFGQFVCFMKLCSTEPPQAPP